MLKGRFLKIIVSLAIPLVACLLQYLFWDHFQPFIWFLFYPAVFLSALIGGRWGGLAAAVLSTGLANFFFAEQLHTFTVNNPSVYYSSAVFILMGILVGNLQEKSILEHKLAENSLVKFQRSDLNLHRLNDELEERIEERVRQLHTTEQRFQNLFENMLEGAQILGFDWRYLYLNEAAQAHNRRPNAELIGRIYMDMWPGIKDTLVFQKIKTCMEERIPCSMENEFTFPDGASGWFELRFQPIPEGVFILSVDITERIRAQRQVAELVKRFDLATHAAHLGVWDWYITEDRLVWDDRMYELYGVKREDFAGAYEAWLNGLLPEDRAGSNAESQKALRGEKEYDTQFRVIWPDGTVRWLKAYGLVIRDAGGTPTRMIGINFDITELVQAQENIQRQVNHLQALHTIDMMITSNIDMRPTLDVLLAQVVSQLNVDAAVILLFNKNLQTLEFAAGCGFRMNPIKMAAMRLGESYAGQAALERRTIRIDHIRDAKHLVNKYLIEDEGFVAYFGVPLIVKGEIKGVMEIFHRGPVKPTPEWLDFLDTLAGQAAIAIDEAQLFSRLQRSNDELARAYDATIEGWSHAMDLRDRETEGHTQRVTQATLLLAQEAGMTNEQIIHVRRGALLHDIGKIGVPDGILLKPGPLTEDEWVIMRQHPVYAYDMLARIDYLRPALDIPYCHHEKWDGTGYPRGLKGEQIPLAARLFAVVDVWDALRSDRPYRPRWPEEKVLAYLRDQSGTHFDPRAVDLFFQVLETDKLSVPEQMNDR